MMSGYVENDDCEEAIEIFRMMEMNIRPDIFTLSVVLHACGCSGSVDSGRDVHRYIVEHGLESDLFVCNSLMDMYAKCGSMEDASRRVHVFVAGDSSHPEIRPIEALLEEIRNKMKEEGFSPKLRYALRNGDDAEKEMALCGHSEKLAMAYGMLNLPPRTVIRVFKNLRICRDCHETAKFVSKSYGKEIIVRDSNFFHHFKDGSCSCRGFW
ncbi:Pentatricopeptide repeat-containing protein DOT4, chloroplastic [Linum grandiflorum]